MHLFERQPARVSSFGSLSRIHAGDRPAGAADRCLDCPVEPSCPYSAPRLYLGCLGDPSSEFWPLSAVTPGRTEEDVLEALRTGPYGRCVYACDNDVVDHQEVVMEFGDGATCSFTMSAFTPMEHRRTRLFGAHGYVDGDGGVPRVVDFRTGAEELAAVATGDATLLRSDAAESLMTHRVVWAAEQARLTGRVVTLQGS
ncbi:hypothetical protein ABGB14_02800 [Nonomuraea sp. B10E15]|uniref:hypothetical protein n=1 Tax=Nonomuraea sp. B10E15 TaxID=3153560 RepID=UPI00325E9B91